MKFLPLLMTVAVAGCAAGSASSVGSSAPRARAVEEIRLVLSGVVDAWNRDDLDGHVRPYADSATYMQPTGPLVGRTAIREMLRQAFQQSDGLAGNLVFRDVDIRMVGDSAAVALGAFIVEKVRADRDIRGRFTLILRRSASGWQIVHDHSS